MSQCKWIQDLTPTMPLVEAARRVLAVRLQTVREALPPALHEAAADIEHVHRLRVSTRRARAALDIFAACLTDSVYRAAKKQLRRIRRAAGAARDWDVFLTTLTASKPRPSAKHWPGRHLLTGFALAQRRAADDQLAALGADFPLQFERLQAEVLSTLVHNRSKATMAPTARILLKDLVGQLAAALAGNLEDYAHLHQVRITGKRLRYALEVFAACLPSNLRERLYPAIEEMQEILGLANDSHVSEQRLEHILSALVYWPHATGAPFRPGIEALRAFHAKRLIEQRQLFDRWREYWARIKITEALEPSDVAR